MSISMWNRERKAFTVTITALVAVIVIQYAVGIRGSGYGAATQELSPHPQLYIGTDNKISVEELSDGLASVRTLPERIDGRQGTNVVSSAPATSADAPESLRKALQDAMEENDKLRAKAFSQEVLRSESETESSLRAKELLSSFEYTDGAVDAVNLESRVCLRGVVVNDEDILWMGDCAASDTWPIKNEFGSSEVQLSIARRLGPKRLAEELEMVSLWNMLYEAGSREGVVSVWGAHFPTIYRRLPPNERNWMKANFGDELRSHGVDI